MSLDKKELKFYPGGGITIIIKAPDHRPPHVHAYQGGKEDIIMIETQSVHNFPANLSRKQLKKCQQWIKENKGLLMKQWNELEKMGHISVPRNHSSTTEVRP